MRRPRRSRPAWRTSSLRAPTSAELTRMTRCPGCRLSRISDSSTTAYSTLLVHSRRRPCSSYDVPPEALPAEVVAVLAKDGLGQYGENVAVSHLRAAGLTILDRNWRCDLGEI